MIGLLRRRSSDPRIASDLAARGELGRARYGQPLRAWAGGRDPLIDWAQEQYDAAMYAGQAMLERSDEDEAGGGRLPVMLAHRMLMHSLDGAELARRVLDVAETRPRRVLTARNGPDRDAGASQCAPGAQAGQ